MHIDVSCLSQIFSLKALVKSYLPVKDVQLRAGIDDLIKILKNMLLYGEISKEIKSRYCSNGTLLPISENNRQIVPWRFVIFRIKSAIIFKCMIFLIKKSLTVMVVLLIYFAVASITVNLTTQRLPVYLTVWLTKLI